jgi:hypothetical protein
MEKHKSFFLSICVGVQALLNIVEMFDQSTLLPCYYNVL